MTWTPLSRVFCAESMSHGIEFAHTYHAPDSRTAERIAQERGWRYCGELVDEVYCSDEDVAQIEKDLKGPSIH